MDIHLKNIFSSTSRYNAINISITSNVLEYQLIEISSKNNELKLEKRFSSNAFEDFKAKLNKDYPVILHIEGDNIINKLVENKAGYRNDLIFKANPNEFHFFEYHQNQNIFISVARKQYIESVIKQISDSHFYIIHVSFGPFVMANLLPIIKDYDKISSLNYTLNINDKEILSFKNEQTSPKEYEINGECLNQREIPLLAAFLDYKYPNPAIEFDTDFLDANKTEFKFKKWFKMTGIFTLVFFLITLSTSHYLKDFYLNELAEKESLNVITQQTILKVNALKDEKILKEKILLSSGIGNKSFLTKYIMDIGNSVSQNITLNAMQIIPPLKKIKTSEKMNFDMSVIKIVGACENNKSFNDWLKKLKALAWIKKIDIEDYSQETKTENTFTLSIKI
ncbi:hypothetical protein [Mariniflexile sp. HMF6888]|uniref:hypothetical protein n=1 Tax=Mariniflexile sp. HMF6888 TaxID=3373086 RepID=UPI0037A9E4D0